MHWSISLGLIASAMLVPAITVSQVKYPVIGDGPSSAQFTYPGYGLDGPRVDHVNSTVFDWWYFDMVSDNVAEGDLSSVVAVFHDGTSGGFQTLLESPNKIPMTLGGTYPNGTIWRTYSFVSEAVVVADETHSQGSWGNIGHWAGDVETGTWAASFDFLETHGVRGTFRLEQRAPPHFSCGLVEAGASEVILPHVGWINTVPDARAIVDIEINGTALSFSGTGYHDKNWGDRPFFNDSVLSWYWGHASLGPYSIVWFDAIDTEGTEHFSSYVARDGEVLTANCEHSAVVARPWGEDTYPPPAGSEVPEGFILTFADVEGRDFRVNVTTFATPVPNPLYNRFIGTVEGSFEGGNETFIGVASYEQFKAA